MVMIVCFSFSCIYGGGNYISPCLNFTLALGCTSISFTIWLCKPIYLLYEEVRIKPVTSNRTITIGPNRIWGIHLRFVLPNVSVTPTLPVPFLQTQLLPYGLHCCSFPKIVNLIPTSNGYFSKDSFFLPCLKQPTHPSVIYILQDHHMCPRGFMGVHQINFFRVLATWKLLPAYFLPSSHLPSCNNQSTNDHRINFL
jgi:hypothetical protein